MSEPKDFDAAPAAVVPEEISGRDRSPDESPPARRTTLSLRQRVRELELQRRERNRQREREMWRVDRGRRVRVAGTNKLGGVYR